MIIGENDRTFGALWHLGIGSPDRILHQVRPVRRSFLLGQLLDSQNKYPYIIVRVRDEQGRPVEGVQIASVVGEKYLDVTTTDKHGRGVLFGKRAARENLENIIRPMLVPSGYGEIHPDFGPLERTSRDAFWPMSYFKEPTAFLRERKAILESYKGEPHVGFTVKKIEAPPLPSLTPIAQWAGRINFRVLAGPNDPVSRGFVYSYSLRGLGREYETQKTTTDDNGIIVVAASKSDKVVLLDLIPYFEDIPDRRYALIGRPIQLLPYDSTIIYDIYHQKPECGLLPMFPGKEERIPPNTRAFWETGVAAPTPSTPAAKPSEAPPAVQPSPAQVPSAVPAPPAPVKEKLFPLDTIFLIGGIALVAGCIFLPMIFKEDKLASAPPAGGALRLKRR